jgi:hypothetical protein
MAPFPWGYPVFSSLDGFVHGKSYGKNGMITGDTPIFIGNLH